MDTIIELIEKSDLNQMQKNIQKGRYLRGEELQNEKQQVRTLVEESMGWNSNNNFSVIASFDDAVFVKVKNSKDKWDIAYPFRVIILKNNTWRRIDTVSSTIDEAMLTYLEHKHLDGNSRFTNFACKMLDIELKEI